MHSYQIGEPYHPDRTRWPEASQFSYRQGGYELVLFMSQPTATEITSVGRAGSAAEFALVSRDDLVVLVYRFGSLPWSDAPYSWHLVPEDQRALPAPVGVAEPHDLLQVILVDASTGIVRGLRVLAWPTSFSAAMRLAIRAQASRPWPGSAEYDRQLADLYDAYPHSRDLARIATSRAGITV
jgi:hypothetical protein